MGPSLDTAQLRQCDGSVAASLDADHLPAEQGPAEWCVAGSAVEEVGAALHGQPVQHAEQGVQAGTGCQVIIILLCISLPCHDVD